MFIGRAENVSNYPVITFSTFEVLTFKHGLLNPVLFAIIHRPPKPTSRFLAELPEFLSSLVLNYDRDVLNSDFNIHVDDSTNVHAIDF